MHRFSLIDGLRSDECTAVKSVATVPAAPDILTSRADATASRPVPPVSADQPLMSAVTASTSSHPVVS